jgi:hypothetical protein
MTNPSPARTPAPQAAPLPVLLSASVPDEIAGTPAAQRLYDFVAAIVEAIFDSGAMLVFGGHPTITPLVHQLARSRADGPPPIALYQLERFRAAAPPESTDTRVFGQVHWVGDPTAEIAADLRSLREPMVRLARAAVFIGGKTTGFSGDKPGIRDEYERFRAHHPLSPVYLVGATGGETARIIQDAAGADWEQNGLRGEARAVLHASHDPRIVAALIARDIVDPENRTTI